MWQNTSQYNREDKVRIPTTWQLQLGTVFVVVTRHIHYPDTWLLRCSLLARDLIDLRTDNSDEAKAKAITLVRTAINSINTALTKI